LGARPLTSDKTTLRSLLEDIDGVTLIEYGLIAGLVALVSVAALVASGQSLQSLWQTIASSISGASGT
jgi:pilus assembly protein Flp/PilA